MPLSTRATKFARRVTFLHERPRFRPVRGDLATQAKSGAGKTTVEDPGQAAQQSPEQQAGERDGGDELTGKGIRNVGMDALELRSPDRVRHCNETEAEKHGPG